MVTVGEFVGVWRLRRKGAGSSLVDHYTAGSVNFPAWAEGSPATLDPTAGADRTRRIRDAMTVSK